MIDIDKYEEHLADALVAVREGGVNCDFSKIRIEDALADMSDLIAEVKRLHEGIEKLANSMEISANKGKNRISWPTRLLWVDALRELIENTKGRTSKVKRLQPKEVIE